MQNNFDTNGSPNPAHDLSAMRSARELPPQNVLPVRSEQVERARGLLADATYPPEETLNRIAQLFAHHLK